MFPEPFIDLTLGLKLVGPRRPRRLRALQRSASSGLPEMNGEVPIAGLADEILTPGKGQVRGLFVFAGNPVMSAPGGTRLDEALSDLEFMVSVDQYVNETNRHADVILPPGLRARARRGGRRAAARRHPQPHPLQPRRRPEARGRQGGLGDPERPHEAPRARDRDQGAGVLARRAPGIARTGRRIGDRHRPLRNPPPRPEEGPHSWTREAREARRRPGADEATAARRAPVARTSGSPWPRPRCSTAPRSSRRSPPSGRPPSARAST